MHGYALPQNCSVNNIHTEIMEIKPRGLVRGLAHFITIRMTIILSDPQKS
jgi:hypothetical protein